MKGFEIRSGFFIYILFIMVYKFRNYETDLEVELLDDECIISIHPDGSQQQTVYLSQQEVYKLIGCLHEIQKDMLKGGKDV